jgi:hypothetical protein
MTEYSMLKVILDEHVKNNPDFDGHDRNTMIRDTCKDVSEKLNEQDKSWLQVNVDKLTGKVKGMTEPTALELLAAIGNLDLDKAYLNKHGVPISLHGKTKEAK